MSLAGEWLGREVVLAGSRAVMPCLLARSALFSSLPANSRRKVFTTETRLSSWGGLEIYQRTGTQLTQSEAGVWLELVRLALAADAQPSQPKVRVIFTANALLRALGRAPDSKNRKDLRAVIARLGDVRLRVIVTGISYTGNLLVIADAADRADAGYAVFLDRWLASLFLAGWSFVNLEQRAELRGNSLAMWLHLHYSTHRSPYPISHEKLKLLAGRPDMRPDKWLPALRQALAELQRVTAWQCKLDGSNVKITKREQKLGGDASGGWMEDSDI